MIEEIKITSLSGRGSVTMKRGDRQGYWLGPVDWGQAEGTHNMYSYHNQVGASIVSTNLKTRPLSITGWVLDDAAIPLRQRCDFLNAFFSPVEDYELEYEGKKIVFRPDDSVVYFTERAKNNEMVRRFLIQATCPFPLFSDREDTAVPFDESGSLFHFPTDWGQETPVVFAVTEKSYSVTIQNTGGFSTGLTALIEFNGPVDNPRLYNQTQGKFIGVNRSFVRGERLEICTTPGSKSITLLKADGSRESLMKYRDYRTSWIQLDPGGNVLALDCEDESQRGSMEATVYFTPLYLEVE